MTRGEIIARFRQENPEITKNVAKDTVLQSWCEIGNLEIGIKVRLIKGDTTFSAGVSASQYNLSNEITKFYDIDEFPGGGVSFDDERLTLVTIAQLDEKRPSWRTSSNGTPKDYYRRGQYLYLGTPPDTADDIQVYTILLPDALDDNTKTPFNQLTYLEPFHYSLVLYLKMRVFMGKVKKPEAAGLALQEYNLYVDWMKTEVDRGIYAQLQIRPPINYRATGRTLRK